MSTNDFTRSTRAEQNTKAKTIAYRHRKFSGFGRKLDGDGPKDDRQRIILLYSESYYSLVNFIHCCEADMLSKLYKQ